MAGNKGKTREDQSYQLYQSNVQAAQKVDPLEEMVRKYKADLFNWWQGKGADGVTAQPIDVAKMPGSGADLSLYQHAAMDADAGRQGQGLALAGDGNKSNYTAQLADERQRTNNRVAGGMLEDRVAQKLGGLDGELTNLAQMNYGRKMQLADMSRQGYQDQVNRPKSTPWWQQMLVGGANAAATKFM